MAEKPKEPVHDATQPIQDATEITDDQLKSIAGGTAPPIAVKKFHGSDFNEGKGNK